MQRAMMSKAAIKSNFRRFCQVRRPLDECEGIGVDEFIRERKIRAIIRKNPKKRSWNARPPRITFWPREALDALDIIPPPPACMRKASTTPITKIFVTQFGLMTDAEGALTKTTIRP